MRLFPALIAVSLTGVAGVVLVNRGQAQQRPALFSDKERAAIVTYWSAPGRYSMGLTPDIVGKGPWVVRQTAEGSEWLLRYQRKITAGKKIPPSKSAQAPDDGVTAGWDPWIAARIKADRAAAQEAVDASNAALKAAYTPTPSASPSTPLPPASPTPSPKGERVPEKTGTTAKPASSPPPSSGEGVGEAGGRGNSGIPPIPPSLLEALGNPPSFARAVLPMGYKVMFDKPEETYTYTDHVRLGERFAYYRFPLGVVSYGAQLKDMEDGTRGKLFTAAGFSPSERKIFEGVSGLEGGFETVQTYDTGYVSVGFIQFVTLAEGKHDLSKVLLSEKKSDPKTYEADFRRFGIDVADDDSITVIDPATGAELVGPEAVKKIIDDKRLLAVFQRAGRNSEPFKVAQIKIAKSFYWPTDDKISVPLAEGARAEGTIGQVVKSEAGLATLLDRKINTGNTRPLEDVVGQVMQAHSLTTLAEVAPYEKEIVAKMEYRTNFLERSDLQQPPAPPEPKKPDTPEVAAKKRNFWQKLWGRLFGG
ncbi:MAG: hypothetical protein QM758_20320 [Armatimonas sp.]